MSKLLLGNVIRKYYPQLEAMVNDLAVECTGGEECSVTFPLGKVIIKLK